MSNEKSKWHHHSQQHHHHHRRRCHHRHYLIFIPIITGVLNDIIFFSLAVEGETFQNTSWVNHFNRQSVEIGNLSPELYEFKTVARNDYPDQVNPKTSPASDVTEARPFPGVLSKFLSFVTQLILERLFCNHVTQASSKWRWHNGCYYSYQRFWCINEDYGSFSIVLIH